MADPKNPYPFDERTSSARAARMQMQGRMQDSDDPINHIGPYDPQGKIIGKPDEYGKEIHGP